MRIIVLSDTHSGKLLKPLVEDIKKSDLIIHAGDFTGMTVLEELKKLKNVKAVYGNMDGLELRQILPREEILKVEDVRIALYHGEGAPEGLLERIRERFRGGNIQAVIFGPSHQPMAEVIDGVLYLNPGSPTDKVRAPFRSYGVLEVNGSEIEGKIVKLK